MTEPPFIAVAPLSRNDRIEDFNVPTFSHIHENLWLGGCPTDTAPEEVTYLVSLYPWGRYKTHKHQYQSVNTMYDSHILPDLRLLDYVSDMVNDWRARGVTLVHCQKGINRSSLVVALALIKSGMQPKNAIALLRQKRSPFVLQNRVFEAWLMCQDEGCTTLKGF